MRALTVPVEVAWWLAWGTLAVVCLIVLGLLWLRWLHWRDEPRQAAFQARWRPVLMRCLMGDSVVDSAGGTAGEAGASPLPALAARERRAWLQLWLRCQMSVQGPGRQRLAELGRTMGCRSMALEQIRSSHYAERMTGLLTLGFLQEADAAPVLLQRLSDGSNHTVIFASRALLEIDEQLHAQAVARALLACEALDLSLASVLLKPLRRALGQALLQTAPMAAPMAAQEHPRTLHWLRLARALQLQLPHRVLAPLLAHSQDTDTLIAAIRLSQGESSADAVLAHARHPDWRVRAQVAHALGFIGTARELPLLASMTTDAQWWVRHRAAQALLRIPQQGRGQVQALVAATGDRFAIEMLQAEIARTGSA